MNARRFSPPWTVEELDECFVVHDHSGQSQDSGVPLAVVLNHSHLVGANLRGAKAHACELH
jgi:hypothetical protein